MKIKKMLKKGGIADIVTLMIIVGLVIALIVAVVVPMVRDVEDNATDNSGQLSAVNNFQSELYSKGEL